MDNKKVDWLKRLKLLIKALEKKGVKTNLWTEIETKISGYELDFSEHDKPFEDGLSELGHCVQVLEGKIDTLRSRCTEKARDLFDRDCYGALTISCHSNEMEFENKQLKQRITELESKETEKTDEIPDSITIDGYKCKIIKTESGLYISRDEIYSIIDKEKEPIKKQCKELEDRHQSDCIEINRLNTTIDVLIHKVEYLRQFAGLE